MIKFLNNETNNKSQSMLTLRFLVSLKILALSAVDFPVKILKQNQTKKIIRFTVTFQKLNRWDGFTSHVHDSGKSIVRCFF